MVAQHSALALDQWPFELFLYFTRFLDATDLLRLRLLNHSTYAYASSRSAWRVIAEEIVKERPIPLGIAESLASLANSDSSDVFSLIKALTTACRVHKNWTVYPQPRLRKILVFQPGALKRAVDIAVLLTPGSRYLISTEFYEEDRQNRLTISDIQLQVVLGVWCFPEETRLLAYRSVEHGAAVMFAFHPGIIGPDFMVEYELVRFEFPTTNDVLVGRFLRHSYFRQAHQLQDLSISEDIILMTNVEQDGTISFDVLNWRDGRFGRVRTGIVSPNDKYNLNITGQYLALWVHHPNKGRIYNYPMEIIDHCLQPDVEVVDAPIVEPIQLTLRDTTPAFSSHLYIYSQRARVWESMFGESLMEREMLVTQYWRNPTYPSNATRVRIAVSNYRLPIPATNQPLIRTWITERDVGMFNPSQGDPYPFIDFNHKHGIWIEILPDGKKVMRYCSIPLHHERTEMPTYFDETQIKTFPIPSTFNLDDLHKMSLDEPSGVLGLTFSDGRLWLLYFDGYEDERMNITTETLQLMFPLHMGPYSLNRTDLPPEPPDATMSSAVDW